jgi:hypothetical protein
MNRAILLLAPLALLSACASAGEPPAAPTATALDTLRAGGSFDFVLDESAPSAMQHTRCASEHPNDTVGAGTCYDAVREVASHEGIKFSLDGSSRLVWTSYGREAGQPVTYIEVPLTTTLEADGVVAARLADRARGLQVDHNPMNPTQVLRFQVIDANTIVTIDPQKGKLLFRRNTQLAGG